MIEKKLIHFNKKATFNSKKSEIKDTSIVFIKDTQEIYTHGQLYSGKEVLFFNSIDQNLLASDVNNSELSGVNYTIVMCKYSRIFGTSFFAAKYNSKYYPNFDKKELYMDVSTNLPRTDTIFAWRSGDDSCLYYYDTSKDWLVRLGIDNSYMWESITEGAGNLVNEAKSELETEIGDIYSQVSAWYTECVKNDEKGQPSGVATLDSDGKVPSSQLPNSSITAATASALGGIKVGYTTSGKNYKVQLDSSNNAYVYVPWTDSSVTSASNHYTPTTGTYTPGSGTLNFSNRYVITEITKDGKGHITAVNRAQLPVHAVKTDYVLDLSSDNTNRDSSSCVYVLNYPDGSKTITLTDAEYTLLHNYIWNYDSGSFLNVRLGQSKSSSGTAGIVIVKVPTLSLASGGGSGWIEFDIDTNDPNVKKHFNLKYTRNSNSLVVTCSTVISSSTKSNYTSWTGVEGIYKAVYGTFSSDLTLGVSSTYPITVGSNMTLIMKNTSSASCTISLTNFGLRNVDTLTLASNDYAEINILNIDGTLYARAINYKG